MNFSKLHRQLKLELQKNVTKYENKYEQSCIWPEPQQAKIIYTSFYLDKPVNCEIDHDMQYEAGRDIPSPEEDWDAEIANEEEKRKRKYFMDSMSVIHQRFADSLSTTVMSQHTIEEWQYLQKSAMEVRGRSRQYDYLSQNNGWLYNEPVYRVSVNEKTAKIDVQSRVEMSDEKKEQERRLAGLKKERREQNKREEREYKEQMYNVRKKKYLCIDEENA